MGISVAVVGCGHWGRNLVRNFGRIGALSAVCDVDPEIAAVHAGKHGVPVRGFDEILADAAIDAVAVATPAVHHADLAGQALAAGKHVFVEKPLALRSADAEGLIEQAREGDRVLMVGHLLQYHPAFLALRDLIAAGRLGRLQYIYSNRLNLGKIRREENVFWSFAPHDISMILTLAGEMPTSVVAKGASYLHNVIADVTNTYLSFANGINAHIFVSWLHPYKDQKLVVVGSEGMAVFDDTEPWAQKLRLYAHKIGWKHGAPEPERAEAEAIALDEAEPLRLECEHFIECVESGATPRTDGAEGLAVLRVLEAAEASLLAESTSSPWPPGMGEAGVATVSMAAGSAGIAHGAGPDAAAMSGRGRGGSGAAPGRSDEAAPFPGAFVHESSYVDDGCTVGPGTKVWHFSHVLSNSHIGADCVIGQNVMIGPDVTLGDGCKIQNNVSLYKGVTLEEGVFCGPSCVFTNVINPRAEIERKEEFLPTRVGKGATIGANATILCGNDLGAYSFVAAGAVVTRDVPAYALVAGVPAQRIGWMSPAGERLGDDLVCPRTGRRFEEVDGELVEVVTHE